MNSNHWRAFLVGLAALSACGDDLGPPLVFKHDSAVEEEEEEDAGPADAGKRDAGHQEADEPEPPPMDSGSAPIDSGSPMDTGVDAGQDAGQDAGRDAGDANVPPVIDATTQVMEALCSDARDSVKLMYTAVTRGSWQYNPGGPPIKLMNPGYSCSVFLEEKKMRPKDNDPHWTDAKDGAFLGFSETSAITTTDYSYAQFRYFRSLMFIPKGANLTSLTVRALGIDDSVYLEITNSRYPNGFSPLDAGPSDPAVGACHGNGMADWNIAKYLVEDETNVILVVHADLAAMTSTLTSVELLANNAPIQIVSCKK